MNPDQETAFRLRADAAAPLPQDLTLSETPVYPDPYYYRTPVFTIAEMPVRTYVPVPYTNKETGQIDCSTKFIEAVENADGVKTSLQFLESQRPSEWGQMPGFREKVYSSPAHLRRKWGCKAAGLITHQKHYYDQQIFQVHRSQYLGPEQVQLTGRPILPPHIIDNLPDRRPPLGSCRDFHGTRPHHPWCNVYKRKLKKRKQRKLKNKIVKQKVIIIID